MLFSTLTQFLEWWNEESILTRRMFEALTDESLGVSAAAETRTIGRIAWHITGSFADTFHRVKVPVEGSKDESPVPATAREIVEAYGAAAASLAKEIRAHWTDESLGAKEEIFGESWTRSFILQMHITHEIHHRGQLGILMRVAGLKVPGIYGPAREDWAQWGMQPPAV